MGGSQSITVYLPDKNIFSSQSDDRRTLIKRLVDSRGLRLIQQPIHHLALRLHSLPETASQKSL